MSNRQPHSRVLVLGMDGLDPRRLERMITAGELPHFERLREQGTLSTLATSNPAESPVAWSSLATSCDSGGHGIFDFIHRDPQNYAPYLSIQREGQRPRFGQAGRQFVCPRRAPGFWRLTSDAGVPTTVLRWPVTFPAEPVNGNFLAGLGVPDVAGRMGRHMFYTTAEVDADDDKAVRVRWRGERIETHLFGPDVSGLRGSRPLRVPLTIERRPGAVVVAAGSQRVEVGVGEWSSWLPVTCKWGPLRVCDAIVKFRLIGLEPDLGLFATPLQIDPRRQLWPLTEPAAYGVELARGAEPYYTLGLPEDTHAVTDGRYDLDAFLQQCTEIDGERRAMFEHELGRFEEGVLAVVFDSGDRLQHMFWSIDDPASPMYDPERAARYRDVVPNLYREMDALLAKALATADADTAIYVVSDHGFAPFHRAVHLNRWLTDHGFMKLSGATEGRRLLADVDWSSTRAYAVGFTSIYLNLVGRESRGIVEPSEQAMALRREVAAALQQAVDPDTGCGIVERVYTAEDIYSGPHATRGPDLVVGYKRGYRASWQTALGGAPAGTVADNDSLWAADHLMDPSAVPGVLASNVRIGASHPQGLDLAPTVLASLGLPAPSYMQGRSWLEGGEVEDASPEDWPEVAEIPVGAPDVGSDGLTDEQRSQLEEHLGDLGYL